MVGFDFQTYQVAATTVGTPPVNQDLSISGIGTPKGMVIEISGATTNNGVTNHARWGFGVTDGSTTDQGFAWSTRSEHGQTTSDSGCRRSADTVVQFSLSASNSADGIAHWDSWITDGARIVWDDLPATGVMMNVTFFYGDDFDIDAHTFAGSTTDGGTASFSGVTWKPRMMLVYGGQGSYPVTPSSVNSGRGHVGVACEDTDGTITQGSLNFWDRDNRGTTQVAQIMRDDAVQQQIQITGGGALAFTTLQAVDSFNDDGYTMSTNGGTAGMETVVLLFRLPNNMRCAVRDISTELETSATGIKSIEPGFEVGTLKVLASSETTINDTTTTRRDVEMSSSFASLLGSNSTCSSIQMEENSAFSDTSCSSSNNRLIRIIDQDEALLYDAQVSSADADGVNINVLTSSASDHIVMALLIGIDRPNIESLKPYAHTFQPNTLIRL